jgi:transposase InsO family protein
VLEANGYVTPKSRRVEVHDQTYEAVRPNHLWHLDFLHRFINRLHVYILLIIDDYSRFIVGGAIWDGERAVAVQETFLASVTRHGKPEKVMSDGGSAFYAWRGISAFTRLVEEELESDHLVAKNAPTNGKIEALNATVQKELFNKEMFFDLGEAQHRLANWIRFYNLGRTHTSLGGILVPADRFFGRVDEVMAAVESGHSATGIGEPLPLSERHLDLFRISSHRGHVEVYLLGHRVALPLKPAD